jgi:4-carboxymuconolactone decarboxylase
MSHLPDPTAHLNPAAQKIYDQICAKRGSHHWPGLYPMLMNYPELAEKFAVLSSFLRFDAVLSPHYREFTILNLAARLRSAYEFATHLSYARAAGISEEIIQQLAKQNFSSFADPIYSDINNVIEILFAMKIMPQELQDSLVTKIGLAEFLQLNVLIGWYRMIASFVVAYEFPLPPGMENPFG